MSDVGRGRSGVPPVREWLGEVRATLGRVTGSPNLRRVQLAWIGSDTGEMMTFVIFGVYAFEVGGAGAVGLMGLIRTAPAAVAVPFVAAIADRYPRERVMVGADLVRIALVVAAAAIIAIDGSPLSVFLIAGVIEIVSATFRPAQQALMPSLAADEDELTAANTVTSTVESTAAMVGPAIGGLILAVTSIPAALAACAAAYIWSVSNVVRIRRPDTAPVEDVVEVEQQPGHALLAGFRAVAADRDLRLIVALFGLQTATWGAVQVLVTVLALSAFDLGDGGPGLLFAGSGLGGILGAIVMLAIAARVRLGPCFGAGVLLWGAPLVLIAILFNPFVAFAVLIVTGIGNSLADVAGVTLLQRIAPEQALARVFGILESIVIAGIGVGAIIAPVLIDVLGLRGALTAVAVAVAVTIGLTWGRLRALDDEFDDEKGGTFDIGAVADEVGRIRNEGR